MKDLIERQAAIDAVLGACKDTATTECAVRELEELPSAQPERKRGHWINLDSDEENYDDIRCSNCGMSFTVDAYGWCDIGFTVDDLKFCPNCGERMEEGGE